MILSRSIFFNIQLIKQYFLTVHYEHIRVKYFKVSVFIVIKSTKKKGFKTTLSTRQFSCSSLSLVVNLSACACQEVSLRVNPGHCSLWHLEKKRAIVEGKVRQKKGVGEGRRVGGGQEGEWSWQRPWNRSVPVSRARGVCSQAVSTSH